jgi:hypothetical protein
MLRKKPPPQKPSIKTYSHQRSHRRRTPLPAVARRSTRSSGTTASVSSTPRRRWAATRTRTSLSARSPTAAVAGRGLYGVGDPFILPHHLRLPHAWLYSIGGRPSFLQLGRGSTAPAFYRVHQGWVSHGGQPPVAGLGRMAGANRAPAFHRCPEAASQELVPLACACDHLREANDRSYLPHPSHGRSYHTEVDVQGRHERGHMRSFDATIT